ncbi:MAG: hypothetical protein WC955_05490 [Elusimicrobiota bacterium]
MANAVELRSTTKHSGLPVIGVFATCDPRIDDDARTRAANIVKTSSDIIAKHVIFPDKTPVPVVYSLTLVDGEKQADAVARQFRSAGVNILVCVPDTWAFPQLGLISLVQQFEHCPINLTCGNSGPRPGVVFTHAANGAIAQYGRLSHINVGNWPDTGLNPKMSKDTEEALVDWCYAAVTAQYLRGKRVVLFGHDSMGMETALAHILPTRNVFGIELTRLDMKLLADMLIKKVYDIKELKNLRRWLERYSKDKIMLKTQEDSERFEQSIAMYLIVRNILSDLNAIGGGFMSQLEWGSDLRGIPLPVADIMESLFNSTFDHNGKKTVIPFATEADTQGLLTMLFFTHLSGGNPPLFMDFRKVWEPFELQALVKKAGLTGFDTSAEWYTKGFVDGDNSGSASFDWAGLPGSSIKQIMSKISFPLADSGYFPGMGNSVTFISPGGIEGIAGRLAYSSLSNMFTMIWDEAKTVDLPNELTPIICGLTTPTWPHTFIIPKYASMPEYKQYAPANHLHMTWNLKPSRLQYWMDIANVLSSTPWSARPAFVEGTDRPIPLLYLLNGGETAAKMLWK